MKEIPLTQGKVALIDDEDYERLMQWEWYYNKATTRNTGYAKRKNRINGNGLDNRKENLRVATRAQNQYNKGKYKNNTSGLKGVSWYKASNKWQAQIQVSRRKIPLGLFQDKLEAARAYNKAAIKLYGEFAHLSDTPQF